MTTDPVPPTIDQELDQRLQAVAHADRVYRGADAAFHSARRLASAALDSYDAANRDLHELIQGRLDAKREALEPQTAGQAAVSNDGESR